MAARVLEVTLAACQCDSGAVVSFHDTRADMTARASCELFAGQGVTLHDALSVTPGAGHVLAETLVSADAPLAGPVASGRRITLMARCAPDMIERARVVLPAIAAAAGAALSVALLVQDVRQSRERDERNRMGQYPLTEEGAMGDGASGAGVTSEVIRTISHELRSPLATIKGYASTLLLHAQRLDAVEQRNFLEAIDQATDRLTATIARMLDYSAMASGALLPLVVVNVASLAREALDARIAAAPAIGPTAGPRFTLSACAAPLLARADPRRLRQALDNLLDNAVQYSPRGGEISLSVSAERAPAGSAPEARGHIHVVLRDQGIGIPAEELSAIFRDYHRVDRGLTRASEGLGLGLPIAQRIVELHGGALWAESAPGRGSAFHMMIPAYEEAAGDEAWRPMT